MERQKDFFFTAPALPLLKTSKICMYNKEIMYTREHHMMRCLTGEDKLVVFAETYKQRKWMVLLSGLWKWENLVSANCVSKCLYETIFNISESRQFKCMQGHVKYGEWARVCLLCRSGLRFLTFEVVIPFKTASWVKYTNHCLFKTAIDGRLKIRVVKKIYVDLPVNDEDAFLLMVFTS